MAYSESSHQKQQKKKKKKKICATRIYRWEHLTCVNNNVALGNAQYILFFNKVNDQIILDYNWTGRCPVCKTLFDVYPNFLNIDPQYLIIQPIRPNIIFPELPNLLHIGGKNYQLLCATIYDDNRGHFVSLLTIGNIIFFVDGIGRKCEVMPPFNQSILRRRKKPQLKNTTRCQ